MSPVYPYPYQNFQVYGYQHDLPMHSMVMTLGFTYARAQLGWAANNGYSMIIITPPRVHFMQSAKIIFGR
jgi:peptidoglycan/xylan/chitin deacetylase (PgdA/CDA1 family)